MAQDPLDDVGSSGGEVTLIWWGEVDLDNAHQLRTELLDAIANADAVFVDLTGVTFIDSIGLGVLVAGWKRARAHEVGFSVSVPDGQARRALDLMGLLRVVESRGDTASGR